MLPEMPNFDEEEQVESEVVENNSDKQLVEQRQQLEDQLAELYAWFDEYDNQIKQYERDVRLGQVGTYHIGNHTYTITELDTLASSKAEQITSLRQQLLSLN